MAQFQISRRLTPESREVLAQWQAQYFSIAKKVNPNPTIAVISKKLVSEFFLARPKRDISIPDSLRQPISLEPLGISVRPPLGRVSMLNMIFEDPAEFTAQRAQALRENGAEVRIGHYNPNLHVASVSANIPLDVIAVAVLNRPDRLDFMPIELETS